jgi:regulator of nonsense transcripts 3
MQAPAQAKALHNKPASGVLPIPAAATQTNGANANKSQTKNGNSRLKVHIRRLPPGITHVESQNALGEEWLVGKGKVDWVAFKPGKVSKECVS